MHEYKKTGRSETDKCLELANKAHNLYFEDAIKNKVEFAKITQEFIKAIEDKFKKKAGEENFEKALKKYFGKGTGKNEFFAREFSHIKKRLAFIVSKPNLVDEKTKFILDHTARFIEVILPYICGVEEQVEKNKKFTYRDIISKELTFFSLHDCNVSKNKYLDAFYESGWRAQKNINGFMFIRNHLNLDDPVVKEFYSNYGGLDYISSIIFARMANEQFMKYLSSKNDRFWEYIRKFINKGSSDEKDEVINNHLNDSRIIDVSSRINALEKAGVLNDLIANEVRLVNSRGNSVAHKALPGFYSTCYHNLELLNYLNKYCK